MKSRKLCPNRIMPDAKPRLITEFRLTDEVRDVLHTAFKSISDNQDINPYLDHNATAPIMQNTHVNMLAGEILRRHLPQGIRDALAAVDKEDQPPVVAIRNLPTDRDLPATPKTYSEKFSKGIVSELVCRGIAALSSPTDPVEPQHSYDFRNIVGTRDDAAHLFHIDGVLPDPDIDLFHAALETRELHDMLLCQRGVKSVPTCFSWPKHEYAGKPARRNLPGVEAIALREGDLVLFNNRRVIHGRDTTELTQGDDAGERWMLGLTKMNTPPRQNKSISPLSIATQHESALIVSSRELLLASIGALATALTKSKQMFGALAHK